MRFPTRLTTHGRRVVNALRVVWVLAILWHELGVFDSAVKSCAWPLLPSSHTKHVLLVADPQILDHRSYPDRSVLLTWLSRVFTDLNLRKSWYYTAKKAPDAVVFLGDMMDNGRADMEDAEYEDYFQRFKNIFALESHVPVHYIPGNHDTGLGSSSTFSKQANTRYSSHFGPLNSHFSFAGHTFVVIDAPSLAEEDSLRHTKSIGYDQWDPLPGGPVEFVKMLSKVETRTEPVILLTHIPLGRPAGTDCGPLRERGTIHRGIGLGYQNTLGMQASTFLLNSLQPSLVFSGDDHDFCEYTHQYGDSSTAKEVTVKAFSMAMGIERPGFHLLSLTTETRSSARFAESPCFLPNQLSIYINVYVPLIFLSLFFLVIANLCRGHTIQRLMPFSVDESTSTCSGSFTHRLRARAESKTESLPLPNSSPRQTVKPRNSFIRDVRDVAVYPLLLFGILTWWMFLDRGTER